MATMYAAFQYGVRMTDWYQDRSKLVQSDAYRALQTKCGVEIRSNN